MATKKRKNPAAVALGRRGGKIGGRSTSEAKRRVVRDNGRKGGRPLKGGRIVVEEGIWERTFRMIQLMDTNVSPAVIETLLQERPEDRRTQDRALITDVLDSVKRLQGALARAEPHV